MATGEIPFKLGEKVYVNELDPILRKPIKTPGEIVEIIPFDLQTYYSENEIHEDELDERDKTTNQNLLEELYPHGVKYRIQVEDDMIDALEHDISERKEGGGRKRKTKLRRTKRRIRRSRRKTSYRK